MKKLLILALACAALAVPALSAQERGWVAGVEYEQSNYEGSGSQNRGEYYSRGIKLGAAYNLPLPVKGLFVRPKATLNVRWGNLDDKWMGSYLCKYQSFGLGLNAFAGYRIFKYLEFFTGPTVDWYFYNHLDNDALRLNNGSTYAYWTFGLGVPIGPVTVEGSYRQHLNTPETDMERNRWSVGVTYRF